MTSTQQLHVLWLRQSHAGNTGGSGGPESWPTGSVCANDQT
jgi:hypothetical protein